MEFSLAPGRYVVAVSGGVDSMALLHMLARRPDLELVVAHFNHGIRPDAGEDEALVAQAAGDYGLLFVTAKGQLGPGASESLAREARYEFLRQVKRQQLADAIVTAHHQDDLLETIVLNLLRGTRRKGLTPFQNQPDIVRPLTGLTKADLKNYAQQNGLVWREDSTNQNLNYRRNYIRHQILPRLTADQRRQLLQLNQQTVAVNKEIDELLSGWISPQLDRRAFIALPHDISREVMAAWLRQNSVTDFTAAMIERLVAAAKTYQPGQQMPVQDGWHLLVGKADLALERPER